MKKYAAATLILIIFTGILTGCSRSAADIGKDKAAEIALEDADLSESDITRLHVSKEEDDGQTIYEVEFTNENTEYEYEILASNGDILTTVLDELQRPNEQQTTLEQQTDGETKQDEHIRDSQTAAEITIEEASKLALERVPGASEQDLKIELDYDDGIYTYEGDIIYNAKEYEFEIDANTGDFLEWKEERR